MMIVSMTMTVYDVERVSDVDREAPKDYDAQTADDLDSGLAMLTGSDMSDLDSSKGRNAVRLLISN